jgi:hypothetical protein
LVAGWHGAGAEGGEIEIADTSVGKWIWREELMAKALEVWSLETIEAAPRG